MDGNTSGFNGWKEVIFFEGKDEKGQMTGREGFRNVVNDEPFIPDDGWNGTPPYPTGDFAARRDVTYKYRENYDKIRWEKSDA